MCHALNSTSSEAETEIASTYGIPTWLALFPRLDRAGKDLHLFLLAARHGELEAHLQQKGNGDAHWSAKNGVHDFKYDPLNGAPH